MEFRTPLNQNQIGKEWFWCIDASNAALRPTARPWSPSLISPPTTSLLPLPLRRLLLPLLRPLLPFSLQPDLPNSTATPSPTFVHSASRAFSAKPASLPILLDSRVTVAEDHLYGVVAHRGSCGGVAVHLGFSTRERERERGDKGLEMGGYLV